MAAVMGNGMNRTKARLERKEQVREMYYRKVKEEDIAKEMNLSLSTIRSYISEMGLKRKDWETLRKNVVEMYSSGKEISEIMKKLGVSQPYINRVVKRSGIPTRRAYRVTEKNLIDENTVFADNRVILEKVVVQGKWIYRDGNICRVNRVFTDITAIIGGK